MAIFRHFEGASLIGVIDIFPLFLLRSTSHTRKKRGANGLSPIGTPPLILSLFYCDLVALHEVADLANQLLEDVLQEDNAHQFAVIHNSGHMRAGVTHDTQCGFHFVTGGHLDKLADAPRWNRIVA